jgi:HAD superfamily hydrolase (TIGR01509 family)
VKASTGNWSDPSPATGRISDLIETAGGLIFDMDGVIVNSEPVKFLAYQEAFLALYGVLLDPHDVNWRGRSEPEVIKYWARKMKIEQDLNAEKLIEKKRSVYRRLVNDGCLELVPGAKEFLAGMLRVKKPCGLATTSNRQDQQDIFKLFGLEPFFAVVTTIEDIKRPKPEPEIYLKTAKSLGLAPGRCIAFEDSPPGYTAAKLAGMEVVCVLTSCGKEDFEGSFFWIKNFTELL